MGSTIDLPWAEVSEVTIQPLAGLVQASRVAFGAATDRSFVVNAPADELTARIERALP